ncbi:MAG: hypothetical protein A2X05_03900 [Bacteroidetes bacterium GWE2_41_25]|nr:MAG: hypothetical protein A2X03_03835 [Bacteroidetes bacterium GWA2_40_15]OFX99333.1 MAG: hypothetical protein A2X06_04615 [Bacteroidetes bacterium GWC2_40_22]OFY05858.1 MAG: hypothetical protein A2X05_03900 [Bacteroidetes bacterium GWE2_41_25]OFY59846.1 MAG: hypothetical protein A2X04_10240 [Bacteroidetes bacterium GWF2_41_9]HBH83493.1 hypothetical protein [Bacteroidales bacterium]
MKWWILKNWFKDLISFSLNQWQAVMTERVMKDVIDAIKTICEPLIIQKDTVYPGFVLGAENEINSLSDFSSPE